MAKPGHQNHDNTLNSATMKVFFDEECLLHDPPYEILSGKLQHYYEVPKRLLQIRQALEENAIFQIKNADRSIDAKKHVLQVHSEDYVEYLETAFRLWVEGGGDPKVQTGLVVASAVLNAAHWYQDPLFPETFPNPKFVPQFTTARPPRSLTGKAGESISFTSNLMLSNSSTG